MPLLKPIRAAQLNRSHLLARGLVGCWSADGGHRVCDLSGNGNHGIFYGDAHCVPGKFGWAWSFDEAGDCIDTPFNGTEYSELTFAFWAKSNGLTGIYYLLDNSPGAQGYIIRRSDDRMYIYVYLTTFGSYKSVDVVIPDTGWHFYVGIISSTAVKISIDGGAFQTTTYDPDTIVGSSDTMVIGADVGNNISWNGLISHVMIWNRLLAVTEAARLYQEPFCMFAVTIQPDFLFPACQIVLLAAASTATSSAHGFLTKYRKLAGIIDTAAILSATLTWHYRGPVERQWLVEALFDGMTANAFKLGTVLTGGWFWMRRSGCSALYRGPSMEQIDFANILAVDEQDAGSISPSDYIPHHNHSTYFYVVRRFNNCGYQERTLAAAVKVAIDANGNLVEPQPNNIFACRVDQVDGNKIQLIWFYCPLEQESKPESFRIYYDGGTGYINYENPIATVNYQGRKFYTYQSNALAAGRYLFAVRAEDAAGIENNSLAQLGIQLSTKSPDAINILSAEAV